MVLILKESDGVSTDLEKILPIKPLQFVSRLTSSVNRSIRLSDFCCTLKTVLPPNKLTASWGETQQDNKRP